MGFSEEVVSGDRRRALQALRGELAERIPAASDREAAPLATQLRQVLSELESLDTGEEGDIVDDLSARRAARRAGAADPGGASNEN